MVVDIALSSVTNDALYRYYKYLEVVMKNLIIIICLLSCVLSAQTTADIGTQTGLHLILALDVSGSMKPVWYSAQAAVFALIDELKPGDTVYPVAFGTYARLIDSPIRIQGVEDKLKLRSLFTSQKASDKWTYFRDLFSFVSDVIHPQHEVILLVITDCISDPGPGRILNSDIDLIKISSDREQFPGGGIFVIRLAGTDKIIKASLLSRLRKEATSMKEKGISSAVINVTTDSLINIMHNLMHYLKSDLAMAQKLLQKKSLLNSENSQHASERRTETSSIIDEKHHSVIHNITSKFNRVIAFIRKKWLPILVGFLVFFVIGTAIIMAKKHVRMPKEEEVEEEPVSSKGILYLQVKDINLPPRSYPLIEKMKFTIGTDIPLAEVNYGIAEIELSNGFVTVNPLTSGLKKNGEPIQSKTPLNIGDVITFDSISFVLTSESSEDYDASLLTAVAAPDDDEHLTEEDTSLY